MKTNLYSVYDRVSGLYGELFSCLKDDLAIRKFNYLMSQQPMFAGDCELYSFGDYDYESGIIQPFAKPIFICKYEVALNG